MRLLFALSGYEALGEELARGVEARFCPFEKRAFPDGERYLRLLEDVSDADVTLVGGTVDDEATLDLYDLGSAITANGAQRLSLVVPWFGYSTMERATKPGEVVTAKTRARLLSSIPPASFGNRIFLLDLHSEGLPYYFEGALQAVHAYGKPFVIEAAKRLERGREFVLGSTDAGRAKWVESLANDLGVAAAFVLKRRYEGRRLEVLAASAPVEGRDVIIYDDMIRSGGTLLQAARAYRAAGAKNLLAIATHGVLPGDSLARILESGLFNRIVTTDSHPNAARLASDFLVVESAAPLFVPLLTGRNS